jgi:ubiquinone/menaquinone biosynthesis C-methylase UbiE
MADPLVLPTQEGYDRWAEVYDGDGNPLVALEEPHVDAALGDVRGLTVADVGCGTGRHSLRLARAGAKVTGVDFSSGMLSRAQAKAGDLPVAWVQHDVTTRLPFDDGHFDRVVCGLVLEHIPDLARFFGELRRLCRPDGLIVVSAMHPAMMLRGVQARFTDPGTGLETRPASMPYQLSDYVMGALRGGARLVGLSEHAVDAELGQRLPRAQRYVGWPMLVMLVLRPS